MTKRDKKFTPGPWVTDDSHKRYFGSVYSSDSLGSMIVRMPNMSHLLAQRSTEELKANASLIAAAPEMLNELEKSCAACSRLCGREPEDCEKCNINLAIAKAYGETP